MSELRHALNRVDTNDPTHPFSKGLVGLGLFQDDFFLSGEFQYVLGWKQKLEEEGILVEWFSPGGDGVRGKGFAMLRRGESPLRKVLELIPFIFRVRKSFRVGHWKTIHLFLPSASFLWMVYLFPKKERSKHLFVSCLGEKPFVSFRDFFSAPTKDWLFLFLRLLLRMAPRGPFDGAGYFVGSEGERTQLISDGCTPDKVRVVLPPLAQTGPADSFSISMAESLRVKRSILYIGHFLPPKGVDDLLMAFSRVTEPDVQLVLVWSGLGDADHILRLARDLKLNERIRIIDRIIHKAEVMKSAAGLVLPFRSTFGQVSPPLVLLEAFHVGIPTIVPAWSAWGDICIQNETAFCYPPLKVDDLTNAIRRLLTCSLDKREQMKRNQKKVVMSKSVRSVADLYTSESHG